MLKIHNYNEVIDVTFYLYFIGIPTNVPGQDNRKVNLAGQDSVPVIKVAPIA